MQLWVMQIPVIPLHHPLFPYPQNAFLIVISVAAARDSSAVLDPTHEEGRPRERWVTSQVRSGGICRDDDGPAGLLRTRLQERASRNTGELLPLVFRHDARTLGW